MGNNTITIDKVEFGAPPFEGAHLIPLNVTITYNCPPGAAQAALVRVGEERPLNTVSSAAQGSGMKRLDVTCDGKDHTQVFEVMPTGGEFNEIPFSHPGGGAVIVELERSGAQIERVVGDFDW